MFDRRMGLVARCVTTALASITLAACGLSTAGRAPVPSDAAAVVEMGLISYDPPAITVRAGQTVAWRNASIATHTVTSDQSTSSRTAGFASTNVAPGQVYRHRFDVPGTYRYICTHHEALGMSGTITVTP